jgi:hypothetical protein
MPREPIVRDVKLYPNGEKSGPKDVFKWFAVWSPSDLLPLIEDEGDDSSNHQQKDVDEIPISPGPSGKVFKGGHCQVLRVVINHYSLTEQAVEIRSAIARVLLTVN